MVDELGEVADGAGDRGLPRAGGRPAASHAVRSSAAWSRAAVSRGRWTALRRVLGPSRLVLVTSGTARTGSRGS
jgi:hypothetical protein